jgi:hypothetical protein
MKTIAAAQPAHTHPVKEMPMTIGAAAIRDIVNHIGKSRWTVSG